MSVPPSGPLQDMWLAPEQMRACMRDVVKLMLGDEDGSRVQLANFRLCWELSTPNEDFIISPLGEKDKKPIEGLYMATAGGFHGFKFLPVIGEYVVKMLNGELEEHLARKWDWNRVQPPSVRVHRHAGGDMGFTVQ